MTETRLSQLERTLRLDAEFFRPEYLRSRELLDRGQTEPLHRTVKLSDGNHFTISDEFQEEGIPYYRGQDVTGHSFVEQSQPVCIPDKAYRLPHMVRSHLQQGDVLLSIVGTIGELSLVSAPREATCSCKLAILRPRTVTPGYLAVFLRSRFGQDQIRRFTRGAVQMGLLLEDMDQLRVPRFPGGLEVAVEGAVAEAKATLDRSAGLYAEAEQTLLRALGLDTWQPPEPLTYERPASEAFGAGRLDAEYASPRVQSLLQVLGSQGLTVGGVAKLRKEHFRLEAHTRQCTPVVIPANAGIQNPRTLDPRFRGGDGMRGGGIPASGAPSSSFQYIEISDVTASGEVGSSPVDAAEAPDRATWHVRAGDVVTSTVRPIRRLSALIYPEQDGFVCSSGFAVLDPREVSGELLLVYLRLPVIAELMDLHTTASLYPAISVPDILALPFVKPPPEVAQSIVQAVRDSHAARKHAHALLERAKRAVEIAIEEGEAAALAYLREAPDDGAAWQAPPYEEAPRAAVPGRVGSAHQDLPRAPKMVGRAHPTVGAQPAVYPVEDDPAPRAEPRPTAPAAPRHIPQAILSHLAPGRACSKAELCAALHLTPAEWAWAIRELKESGKVTQTGERRGARYALAT